MHKMSHTIISANETISKLPTEILFHIFSFLPTTSDQGIGDFDAQWRPLRLVCLQWRNVVDMFIYSHLTLPSQNEDHGSLRLERCLKQMDRRPHRWKYLHSLSLNVQGDSERGYCISLIKEATRKGSVINQLALTTEILSFDQALSETIAGLPLTSLDLSGVKFGIGLRTIWKYFNLPTLQHIHLSQITWSDDMLDLLRSLKFDQNWVYLAEEHIVEYQQLNHPDKCEQLLPVGCHQNLKSLVLPVPAAEPDVADLLFLWPAHLKRVTFLFIHDTLYAESYPAPVIESLLNLHRDSLERIELPPIPGNGLPNLSAFHNISELHLHASSFFNTTPFDASSKLEAPCLQRLTIDFTKHEPFSRSVGGSVDPEDFSNHKSNFLEHFIITQKSGQSKTCLRQIFLRFGPETIAEDSILLELWSADLVEEVSAVAASYDISLTYNKPVYVEGRGEFPRRVLDRTQHMIFDLLLEPPTQDGVHVDAIKNSLGLPTAEVESAIEGMLRDGILFTTVDADTFDIIDYFS
ncbi:uncharacterized protein ACHE_60819A [Aspergillus chevalieri]|uniref:F-box domain-containing protein n=1 Tax=Aspergillus chevalieri TaxID=182096 RepID=A0A7R7ZQP5_ASPCH|nr:uncharacterized protein ACHE_60819A [Aspergillus chevalieri]BCR90933.1 hypothetical protein ACHE_60819A [Aspergillus chevalieri]